MAFSPLRSKALHHGRSLSLPSQSHPSVSHFNKNLAKIQYSSSEASSSSLSSMETRVNGLRNLYCNIDDLLMLPHIQHIISQQSQTKWIDQVLDGYIRLLDACTTATDLFSHIKHDVQELLSALRRNDVNGVNIYRISRKKSKKMILKSLKDLRTLRCKNNDLTSIVKDDDETLMALVVMLKEAESVTIAVFECLFSCVSGQEKSSGWSLVSKILPSKKASHQVEEIDVNEFEKVDSFLKMGQEDDSQELMNHLKEMDSSIQVLEEEIECLFRQFIKTRVFLLNILNH